MSQLDLLKKFPNVLLPQEVLDLQKDFTGLMNRFSTLTSGTLLCSEGGEKWELINSRKKAPGLFFGIHAVIQVGEELKSADASDELCSQLYSQARAIGRLIATNINPIPGSFNIAENGEGMVSRDWLHLHIICPTVFDCIYYSVMRDANSYAERSRIIKNHINNGTMPEKMMGKTEKKLFALLSK